MPVDPMAFGRGQHLKGEERSMRKTILGSLKRRGLSVALLVAVGVLGFSAVAAADTVDSINFESYATGNINGQNGWSKSGPYDVKVVNADRFGFGQALQISNAVTSGSFGDQAFSPGLTDPAGVSPLRTSVSRRASRSERRRMPCSRAS